MSIEKDPASGGEPLRIEEPVTRTLSQANKPPDNPYKNEDVINLSSEIAELTNIGQKGVKKKKLRSTTSKQLSKGPTTML